MTTEHASALAAARLRRPERLYPGYILDLDGTVYLGDALLPAAAETVAAVRAGGSRIVFLSNKPLEPPAAYAAVLRRLGVPTADDEVVTSIDALLEYFRDHPPSGPILPITEPLLERLLAEAGHEITCDADAAKVVVVSWDRTFDYAKLELAFRAVRAGARIVATNPDPFCPTPNGGLPDCGAILAAIEVSTGVRADAIVGKPSPHLARVALERLGLHARDVVMVGDRLLTDVAMARDAGMIGALVLTGATALADVPPAPLGPDFILEDLGQLLPGPVAGSVL
jgi:HAD superfamily hydrolase (TIGR01450 family)